MSSDELKLQLQKREVIRKGLKSLRDNGAVPVVLHDHGNDSIHGSVAYVPLEKIISAAGKHHPIEMQMDKESRLALIRDIDYDPKKHQVRHVVFQSIHRDQKAQAEIPIELQGDMPAERAGLMVLKQLDVVEVEALPNDLPDVVTVDATGLEKEGDSITVADLVVPKGVTILTEVTHPIATVEMPKDQLAEADAAAEALAEDAETQGIPEEETDLGTEQSDDSQQNEEDKESDGDEGQKKED